jgi:hypothetical protein
MDLPALEVAGQAVFANFRHTFLQSYLAKT